jgi:hypothetical protein
VTRRLILCADDYAISPAVSRGIRELAAAGRLSATGVMASMGCWPEEAPALKALRERVSVGLHFTLTDQRPLGEMPILAPQGRFPAIGALLRRSLAGRLPAAEVAAELDRQLDAFESHFGRPPDFVDGHQHVHVLPGIWPIVHAAFGRRLDPRRCWLRDCTDARLWRRGSAAKAAFIAILGRTASRAAHRQGIVTNHGFSGFYDYGRQTLADVFPRLLRGAGDGHLLMVHPGHVDAALIACDGLTTPRQAEWAFLSGRELPLQLAAQGMSIAGPGFPIDERAETGHIARP